MLETKNFKEVDKKIEDYGMLNYHVLEGMADWVRVVDKEGIVIYANKTMKESLGESIVGMKCYRVIGKECPCTFCITERSIEKGETVQKEEVIGSKYYSVKSSPVANSKGEIFAAVEVFRDVTRERRLELELIERNKKMSKDLVFAKKIQERILPAKGEVGNVLFDYIYKPSEMLSGDMFDIFTIDDENIGIYISDVVGHGVSASMMTMFIRQTMRFIKDDITSPSIALSELHRRFAILSLEVDKYFTIFYGVFNSRTKQFKYVNAGHNAIPIIYRNKKVDVLECSGYPISNLFEEIEYEEKKIQIDRGDKLIFYTDGITETKNIRKEEFGIERLKNLIMKTEGDLLPAIEREIGSYSWGEQEDDLAIISMEILK